MPIKTKKILKIALPYIFTVLAFYGLVHFTKEVNFSILIDTVFKLPVSIWLFSIIAFIASHIIRAGRIRSEWNGRLNMPWHVAWAITVRHASWVILSPFRTGEAIYVWILNQQGGVSVNVATKSLIALRLQDLFVLAIYTAVLFAPGNFLEKLLYLFIFIGMLVLLMPALIRLVGSKNLLLSIIEEFDCPKYSIKSWIYAALNWPVKIFAISLPLLYLNDINHLQSIDAAVIGEWSAVIPVQPIAGFGTYEASLLLGAQYHGLVMGSNFLATALCVHMLILFITITSAWIAAILKWSSIDLRLKLISNKY
jgi:hypothetical protein